MVTRHFQARARKVHLSLKPKFMLNYDITLITNSERLLIIFEQNNFNCYRMKNKLDDAERLVGRLQVLKDEKAEQELASVPVDPNQAAAKRACCICLIRPRNTVFVPCGHLDVCDTCAEFWRPHGWKENPKAITSVRSAEVKSL